MRQQNAPARLTDESPPPAQADARWPLPRVARPTAGCAAFAMGGGRCRAGPVPVWGSRAARPIPCTAPALPGVPALLLASRRPALPACAPQCEHRPGWAGAVSDPGGCASRPRAACDLPGPDGQRPHVSGEFVRAFRASQPSQTGGVHRAPDWRGRGRGPGLGHGLAAAWPRRAAAAVRCSSALRASLRCLARPQPTPPCLQGFVRA